MSYSDYTIKIMVKVYSDNGECDIKTIMERFSAYDNENIQERAQETFENAVKTVVCGRENYCAIVTALYKEESYKMPMLVGKEYKQNEVKSSTEKTK